MKVFILLNAVKEHQEIRARIKIHEAEYEQLSRQSLSLITTLFDSSHELDQILDVAKGLVVHSERSIDSKDLLSYAQRVAKHTLSSNLPPIPQDSQMRQSLLFQDLVEEGEQMVKEDEGRVGGMDIDLLEKVEEEELKEELLDLDLF